MLDVKKLIAGFLILAIGATASVLIFSSLANQKTESNIAENTNPSPVGNNAFLAQQTGANLTPEITNDPNNLTGALTDTMLNGIMNANPQGPTTDANGNQVMSQPNQAQMIAALSNADAFKNFKAPDWNLEANKITVNITKTYSQQDITTYVGAVNDSLNKNFVKNGIKDAIAQAAINANKGSSDLDPSIMGAVTPSIIDSLNDITRLTVPASLVSFQKSLVKLLVYEKNTAQTASVATQDPVKASLILRSKDKETNLAVQTFQSELQKAMQNNAVSFKNTQFESTPKGFAVIGSLLGIKTTYASLPVIDVGVILNQLKDFAMRLALQLVKNTLIRFIQNKVLAWVQGSGAPQFITNWVSTFVNIYTAAGNAALDNMVSTGVCPSYGPILSGALRINAPSTQSNGFQTCTVSQSSIQGLSQSIQAGGGWGSYVNYLFNDIHIQFFSGFDKSRLAADAAEKAKQNEAVSGNGFIPPGICADKSDPKNGSHYSWSTGSAVLTPNGGKCANGSDPIVTTPGKTVSDALSNTIKSPLDLTINAQGIEGLAVALAESLLSKLADSATQSINNALNGNGDSGLSGITQSTEANTLPVTPLSCSTLSSNTTIGTLVGFMVDGGPYDGMGNSPVYTWSAPGADITTSKGSAFNTSFSNAGTYNVVVGESINDTTSSCQIVVVGPLACSPSSQTVSIGAPFNLSAGGGTYDSSGNAPTYRWNAPSAVSAASIGSTFSGTYDTAGTYNVFVSESTDSESAVCRVTAQ